MTTVLCGCVNVAHVKQNGHKKKEKKKKAFQHYWTSWNSILQSVSPSSWKTSKDFLNLMLRFFETEMLGSVSV